MSGNAWATRDDVLNDLRQSNGRNAGANHLDQYVVEGDRAPPNRQECVDEYEMQYHFGPGCTIPGVDNTAPDLRGISRMLQMVDDLEDSRDSDAPKTIFRNTMTDEISISKLNPHVTEFVPYGPQTKTKPSEKHKKFRIDKSPRKFDAKNPMFIRKCETIPKSASNLNEKENLSKNTNADNNRSTLSDNYLNKTMFIRKTDKIQESISPFNDKETTTINTKADNKLNGTLSGNNSDDHIAEPPKNSIIGWPKRKIEKGDLNVNARFTQIYQTSSISKTNNSSETSLPKKLDVSKMERDDIETMKKQIKTELIVSSKDSCVQKKRDRNVAMATLLKLCTTPTPNIVHEEPIKLITPQYFEALSNNHAIVDGIMKESTVNKDMSELAEDFVTGESTKAECVLPEPAEPESNLLPTTSPITESVEQERKYVDPIVEESISKVNNWFKNADSPKPTSPAPASLKEAIAFKKTWTPRTSVVSPKAHSEACSEKKKTCSAFVPSKYANELLSKYEQNAKSKVVPKDDLGTMLERQLKEKDQQIKRKLLEKKNATSPNSGRSVQ